MARLRRFLKNLGPGLITGAADNDPSGIATHSTTGARFGFGQLWTALYLLPLLIAVQEAVARIGAASGMGLSRAIATRYSRRVLTAAVLLVVVANTINIGADISAVAAAVALIIPIPLPLVAAAFTLGVLSSEIWIGYRSYSRVLKWLSLALLAYPLTAIVVGAPWGEVIRAALIPHIEFTPAFLFLITGVIGTTISPYMFFWQASEEVEEELAADQAPLTQVPFIDAHRRMRAIRSDTIIGMVTAQAAAFFIMVTTATVLHDRGTTEIRTAADAAEALEPLVNSFPNAGFIAKLIFAFGVVGLGALAVPVLAGSTAYALAEAFEWPEGLDRKWAQARRFYLIIAVALLAGLVMNFIGIDPISALVFTAVFNGIASVPLIYLVNRLASDPELMGSQVSGIWSRIGVSAAFVGITAAAIGTLVTIGR